MYQLAFHRSKLCNSALCRQQRIFFFLSKAPLGFFAVSMLQTSTQCLCPPVD